MNKFTLLVCLILLSALLSNAQTIDLELSISSSKPNPALYTKAPLTFTLSNKGNTTATNILVRSLICDPAVNAPNLFGQTSQIVSSSSPAPTVSAGSYDTSFQNWTIPSLAAGATATLTFSVFILTEEERTILGQVISATQTDSDSSPNNMGTCDPSEDDEASFQLNAGDAPPTGNTPCQLKISNVQYPSSVSPGQTINISARVTNTGGATSVPSTLDFYQLAGDRLPYLVHKRDGATIPSLGAGQATTLNFSITLPKPLNINSVFPLDAPRLLDLILVTNDATATTDYLDCNVVLDVNVDYPKADLTLDWLGDADCYESGQIFGRDLRIKNNSNIELTTPIYVALGQNGFINSNNPGIISPPRSGVTYWVITDILSPGEAIILNRPYRFPVTDGPQSLIPQISEEGSNIDDPNPNDNALNLSVNKCDGPITCTYPNLPWLDQLIDNNLCTQCIEDVNIYRLDGEIYVATVASINGCADQFTTVYNCDGTVLCRNGGIAGLMECTDFFLAEPQLIDNYWNRSTECGGSTCDYNNLPWLNARLANSQQLCEDCIDKVEVYSLNGTIYIGFIPDYIGCLDGPLTIYNCDGTVFCSGGGPSPNTCLPFYGQNPTIVETLWNKADRCNDNRPVSIGARAWFDGNNNGIRELTGGGGDIGLSGKTVRLENANGQVIRTGVTNTIGVTVFNNLPAGTYRVAFEIPQGQEATIKFAPGAASGRDSEINPDGKTDFFTLAPGESVSEVGGGFRNKVVGGNKIDLELTGSTPTVDVGIYKRFPVTFTLRNNSSTAASNVVVDLGACKDGQGFGSNTIFFNNDSGLVYSSPSPTASLGSFSQVTRKWFLPSLPANGSATLTLNLFTLTDDERAVIAQVNGAIQEDSDSSPANMVDCSVREDDEASVVINGGNCVCTLEVFPVCGSDGVTYGNPCLAACAGITEYTIGECGTGGNKPDFDLKDVVYFIYSPNGTTTRVTPNTLIEQGTIVSNVQHNVFGTNPSNGSFNVATKIILSIDNIVGNGDDILLKQRNQIYSENIGLFEEGGYGDFTIPTGTPPDRYNLIMKIDANNQVAETNENNNTFIINSIQIIDGGCICPQVVAPVCGSDGNTYGNSCLAECAGIFDYTDGECDDCICPAVVAPVCGSDGVTYGNSCLAECAGIFNYVDGECIVGGSGVDLELELVAPNNYAIYTKVLFQAKLSNVGTVNAENVSVSFRIPDGFVHSSNAATIGEYSLFSEEWNVGTLKAGVTAVLDLTLFALGTDDVTAYAQVSACQQTDIDSTPGNGSCCVADEDDEAVITVSSNFSGGSGNALSRADIHRDLEIKALYPTAASDEINVLVQSKMSDLNLQIFDLQGTPVLQQQHRDATGLQRMKVDISSLPTGIYLLRFEGTAGHQTMRFVKMQM